MYGTLNTYGKHLQTFCNELGHVFGEFTSPPDHRAVQCGGKSCNSVLSSDWRENNPVVWFVGVRDGVQFLSRLT